MNIDNYIPVGRQLYGTPALACPVCGDENIHPVVFECQSPGTRNGRVTIDSAGITIDPRARHKGRGVRIKLKFAGECGHGFEYVLEFYKGSTMVSRYSRNLPKDDEQSPETIWRD